MNYKKTLEQIVRRRKNELMDAHVLLEQAVQTHPALYQTELALRAGRMAEIFGEPIDRTELTQLEHKKKQLLDDLGLTESILKPAPHCKLCMDTGIRNGKFCECVKRLSIAQNDSVELPLHSFSKEDKRFLKDEKIHELYANMQGFCKKFPATNYKSIVLLGSTGTGKTYLASCVANEILKKGYSVVFLTAFGFQSRTLKYHTTFDGDKESHLAPLLDCDLLIIDDLGTESILKNITLEYLFIVTNERLLKNKHIIVTSNLSMEELTRRYEQKLVSRLFDKRICYNYNLIGEDLRKLD